MRDPVHLALLPLFLFLYDIDAQDLLIHGKNPLEAELFKNVFVSCEVTNAAENENPGISWRDKTGNLITSQGGRIKVMPGHLKPNLVLNLLITNLTRDDAGMYRCEATVNGELRFMELHLKTYRGIVVIDASPLQHPTAGTDAIIKCIVEAGEGPMTLYWTFQNDSVISPQAGGRYQQVPKGLKITNISKSDNAVYVCNIAVASQSLLKQFPIQVKVRIKPTMVHPPLLTKAVQGTEFKMECKATGEPEPKYKWFKVGLGPELQPPRYEVDRTRGRLVIQKVQIEDAGTYRCRAENDAGSVQAEADLEVMVPPQIIELHNKTGKEQASQTLRCVATGDPAPSMTWRKEDQGSHFPVTSEGDAVVTEQKQETLKRTELSLTLNNMKPSDTGIYVCRAENEAGSVQKSGKMTVLFKPIFDNTPSDRVYNWPGHKGNVTCVADGDPVPGVTWYKGKGGSKVEVTDQTEDYKISTSQGDRQATSNLTVYVDFENMGHIFGDYTCRGTNSEGNRDHVITMVEARKPEPPTCSTDISTPRTIQFLVTEPQVQGPEVTEYVIEFMVTNREETKKTLTVQKEWRQESDSTQAVPRTRVIINNLNASTPYTFDVYARNAVGRGAPLRFAHLTEKIRVPYRVTFTSHWESSFSHMYQLAWDRPNDGGSPITKYHLRYHEVKVRRPNTTHTTQQWEVDKILGGWKPLKKPIDGNLLQHRMTNLDPLTFYEIEFRAMNALGEGDMSSFIFKTKDVPDTGLVQGSGMPLYTSKTNVAVTMVVLFVIACMQALL